MKKSIIKALILVFAATGWASDVHLKGTNTVSNNRLFNCYLPNNEAVMIGVNQHKDGWYVRHSKANRKPFTNDGPHESFIQAQISANYTCYDGYGGNDFREVQRPR